jgi:ATPase family protein associated with various cellular activities (AAA)
VTAAPPLALPDWASQMRDLFRSGAVSQFLLHGNVFDAVPADGRLLPLKQFLDEVMFPSYDVVLQYDRSRGIRVTKGGEDWSRWLKDAVGDGLTLAQMREPGAALELMDRYLLRTLNLQALTGGAAHDAKAPRTIAVVIDFAEFVVPQGDPLALGGSFSANVVKILGWANDPAVLHANIVSVLIAEGLHDLNDLVVNNPHAAALHVPLPDEGEMQAYLDALARSEFPDLSKQSDVPPEILARRLTGLSRVGARTALALALRNGQRVTAEWLSRTKKGLIERECQGLLEFVESPFTLDQVSGHAAAKQWLREDARLLKQGAVNALPMGYLITGRIGTGKTFLVQCWAGELGVPCVVLKNFRDRWVGATESNLEKIFAVLKALGQVVVFVDEADQAAGRRGGEDSDGGLSGRVYAMLAKAMADTANRGRIIWVFATSRPDLLEVDLKRQGRLDVHVPLFPPQTPDEVRDLFLGIAARLGATPTLTAADLPPIDAKLELSGNELEGMVVRALRARALAPEPKPPLAGLLATTVKEVRPNADTRALEYMDLVAVRECTDVRFLPPRYRALAPEQVEARLAALRSFL